MKFVIFEAKPASHAEEFIITASFGKSKPDNCVREETEEEEGRGGARKCEKCELDRTFRVRDVCCAPHMPHVLTRKGRNADNERTIFHSRLARF